jgi:hypothetical protein
MDLADAHDAAVVDREVLRDAQAPSPVTSMSYSSIAWSPAPNSASRSTPRASDPNPATAAANAAFVG